MSIAARSSAVADGSRSSRSPSDRNPSDAGPSTIASRSAGAVVRTRSTIARKSVLVDPRPAGVRRDDRHIRELRGQLVQGQRVRVPDPRAHAAGHPGAHAGGADVDHDGDAEPGDRLEQRTQRGVVDAEVPHDRVEVEADDAVHLHGILGVADRLLALERVDRAPRADELLGVPVAQLRDVGVAARRGARDRLDVEGDEHGLHLEGLQLRGHRGLVLGHPGLVPVGRQGLDVGALRGDPRRGAGITVQVDLPHPVLHLLTTAVGSSTGHRDLTQGLRALYSSPG
jgi:hypothetical protein